jgi:hypothetical protein
MEEILNQEIIRGLLEIKGQCRGLALNDNLAFIKSKEAEGGLEKLDKTMTEAGYPFRCQDIKPMNFYPVGLEAVIILAMKKAFGYSDEKFEEVGSINARQSLVIRLFAKYFVSLRKVLSEAQKIWNRYYTVGRLDAVELNEKEKRIILKVVDFKTHPLHCRILNGYFSEVVKMIVGSSAVCQETKCSFRGDNHHEFVITW